MTSMTLIHVWHTDSSVRNLCWLYGEYVLCVLPEWMFFFSYLQFILLIPSPHPLTPSSPFHTVWSSLALSPSLTVSLSLIVSLSHTRRNILNWLCLCVFCFFETRSSSPQGLSLSAIEKNRGRERAIEMKKNLTLLLFFLLLLLLFLSAQLLYKPHFVWFKECWEAWAAEVRFFFFFFTWKNN